MAETIELEEEKEEVEGTVLGYGGDEVSIMSVVSPRGSVSVSSLSFFSSIGSSPKPSHSSSPLSLGACYIQEYFKKKRGGSKNSSSHSKIRSDVRSVGSK